MTFHNKLFERLKGEEYFLEHVCPDGYKKERGGRSEYYASYGFDVPLSYSNYYSRVNGIKSDHYMSTEVYYLYALPAMNRMSFASAYTDKNMFSTLFCGVRQPVTVVKNINGHYYSGDGTEIGCREAIELCVGEVGDCIIKPTVDSSEGKGVALLLHGSVPQVEKVFKTYGKNFIVQKRLKQRESMARFNPTSLNTMRIYTYRSLDGRINLDRAFVRFGGEGTVKDNVSAGGGLVPLNNDGVVGDEIFRFKQLEVGSLKKEKGIEHFEIEAFDKVVGFAIQLHQRMPHFDYIGWDIAVGEDGQPVFIEFNVVPFIEGPQLACGPMFGVYLDEVMGRIKNVQRQKREYWVNVFSPGFEQMILMNETKI